jgi:hypothetical protein
MILLLVFAWVAMIAAAYLVNGWALQALWGWFVVPFGLPELPLAWAVGLALLVGLQTNHHTPAKGVEIDWPQAFAQIFLRPILAVLIGWVISRFMGASA